MLVFNMAADGPSKNDISAIFKRLRSFATNKVCFDCNSKNPTWASVTYGVFICIDCSAVHRSLGVHLSFVRSTQLDTNWTWLQLRAMQVGGNANAKSYFAQHNCTTTDAQQKYNSRAATLYREKLHNTAVNAMRLHGNKLHIDAMHDDAHDSTANTEKKEVDFFSEHAESSFYNNSSVVSPGEALDINSERELPAKNGSLTVQIDGIGPNVDLALGSPPADSVKVVEARKPTIGQRRTAPAKKGLGTKKGGLGAQKVSANFSEIEKEAQLADQLREKSVSEEKKTQEKSTEDEAQQMASMRLAYQDLSLQKKQAEDKLKQTDPKKATQMERLGMGFGSRSGQVAHSAASDMKTIEQETPDKPSNYSRSSARDFFEDDFEIIGFNSGPPKYSDSPFTKEDKLGSYGSRNDDKYGARPSKSSSWDSEKKTSMFDESLPIKEIDESHGRSRKAPIPSAATSDEAVKKFGNAKSISSEQFFGNSMDADYERRTNLNRFEGSNSISSSEYFGESSRSKAPPPSYAGPDLEEIREGVRAGVTKVAGKLSSLANGMMNTLQDRYGY